MTKSVFTFLLLTSLSFLSSCGSDNDDNEEVLLPQEEEVRDFATRLSSDLAVSGVRCQGGETTSSPEATYTCQRDEWLISIDDVNVCDQDGRCTEAAVIPFVGKLEREDVVTFPEFTYFNIVAVSPDESGSSSFQSKR